MSITIHRDGTDFGPFSLEDIRQHLAAGSLVLTDLAFAEGSSQWTTLGLIPGVNSIAPVPRPPIPVPLSRPPSTSPSKPVSKTSKSALWSMICGLLSFVCTLFAAVPAVILGHKALGEIRNNPARSGRGMALTGLILGYIWIIIFGVAVVLAVLGKTSNKSLTKALNHSAATSSVIPSSPEKTMAEVVNPPPPPSTPPEVVVSKPNPQKSFITIVDSFKDPYDNAETEVRKTNVRFNRKDALSKYFSQMGGEQFQDWVGQVKEMTTESDGSVFISIQLPETNIDIKTLTNSFSDAFNHTMIQRNDPIYQTLMDLKEGDPVVVSGSFILSTDDDHPDFIEEQSLTEEGSMKEPEFTVKFSKIAKQ